jgi:hypothetical protein
VRDLLAVSDPVPWALSRLAARLDIATTPAGQLRAPRPA